MRKNMFHKFYIYHNVPPSTIFLLRSMYFKYSVQWGTKFSRSLSKVFVDFAHTALPVLNLFPPWDDKIFGKFSILFSFNPFRCFVNGGKCDRRSIERMKNQSSTGLSTDQVELCLDCFCFWLRVFLWTTPSEKTGGETTRLRQQFSLSDELGLFLCIY